VLVEIISPPVNLGEWWWSPLMSVASGQSPGLAKRMHVRSLAIITNDALRSQRGLSLNP